MSNNVVFTCPSDFSTLEENAGYDLRSVQSLVVSPGERKLVQTDLRVIMPSNMYGQIFSRSGLALKGIDVKGGVIDSGYRNTIGVILKNDGNNEFVVNVNDRIAQLVFLPVIHPNLTKVTPDEYEEESRNEKETKNVTRGMGGFGSTGMN